MAVLATAVWRVRPSGNNLNGGGYDPGIGGAATDYSQQNAAQAIGTNGATTGAGVTTFTDATAGAFTSAMVGNCIQIASGTNFQAGFYFVTAFTNANSVVLDRTPSSGGAGSAGVWKLGGGWADFWTNTTSSGPLVVNNKVFILGSGVPNPSAYTYDYTGGTVFTNANGVTFANDPSTPSYKAPPDTTGGMPVVKINIDKMWDSKGSDLRGLYFVAASAATPSSFGGIWNSAPTTFPSHIFGCVVDQFGLDVYGLVQCQYLEGCEVFSSVAGSVGTRAAVFVNSTFIFGCNIHDMINLGIIMSGSFTIFGTIVAKGLDVGIRVNVTSSIAAVDNCTIDANAGSGIVFLTTTGPARVMNCIISNHTVAGKFGIDNQQTAGALIYPFADYNSFYNNTANLNNQPQGAHDTLLGSNPYVGQSTENYTLA